MIEHLQDPLGFLRSLRQAVTPRGVILISTPNLRAGHSAGEENPFHLSEMTFGEFSALLDASFQSYRLLGIAPSTAPVWRRALRRLPFYRWGRGIRRTNPLKRIANRAMDLTNFRVIDHAVAAEAIDLLAICDNE
jgi:2-polyprenyl-3-methyl-5-hydroxy-6-metoxy-1,4-benzoquinol methylase